MIRSIPQIIDHAAIRFPQKEAFRCREQSITYADLVARTSQLAQVLLNQGLKRGDRVGIYMHKCLECAVAIYGIQKAGAAYVPLDPNAPAARINYILKSCNIRHLICQADMTNTLQKLTGQENELAFAIGAEPSDDLNLHCVSWQEIFNSRFGAAQSVAVTPDDLAYIIFTSGSTGTPKGIMHTHSSGLAYARMAAELYGLVSHDRLSNFPPLHFDQSTFDFFSGPLAGATTVIIPEEYQLVPASLSHLMERERLTVWYSVPFALIQLLLRGVLEERDLSTLRWVIYGGEPFPLKHLKDLMALWPHATFSNNYGPAETNQCTYYHIPPLTSQDLAENRGIPIGHVCDGMKARVVDADCKEVASGEEGELLIQTPTAMRGYWQRPDLNEAAFYTADEAGSEKLYYRTGDLVRYRCDGLLEFLGRKDRQIKSRGYRIELDEIESVLLSHPAVHEMAVFSLSDPDDNTLIKAAILLKPASETQVSDMRKFAANRLPPYAVPAIIEIVESFPRTSSGKIDRRALQAQSNANGPA